MKPPSPGRPWLARIGRWALWSALGLWFLWTALTLLYANLSQGWLRTTLFALYAGWMLACLLLWRPRQRGQTLAIASSALVALAYVAVRPSNDRTWRPEEAVAATVEIDGGRVTVHGVRNFHYRSEQDFDARWEDRTYDLSKLRTLDLAMSYWGPTAWCHTIVSFGFEGGEHVAVSAEVRKEVGESFSSFGGFFKQFELSYVWGDERDLLGVRTNHRGEHVQLYRIRAKPERIQELFLSYARFTDGLAREPQFYKTLRNSCGVNILHRVAETGKVTLFGRAALLNGYWDEHLYANGAIDTSLPLEELRRRSRIDAKAQAAGEGPDFSQRIRVDLP
ncbi:MAG: DUF4105 domain-containing protein [Planctomycetota bacterium]|nr:DUF4105 domain-containing protein [Planctomycetota bacterium]